MAGADSYYISVKFTVQIWGKSAATQDFIAVDKQGEKVQSFEANIL